MKEIIQNSKHILYRFKTFVLYKSRFANWFWKIIWREPAVGVVTILSKEEQNISHYFSWTDIKSTKATAGLKEFTERYIDEPNIIYKFSGDLIIEPENGLVIGKGRQFVKESSTLGHIFLRPNIIRYLNQVFFKRNYTYFDRLVHCDGFAGINLCHFIYDTINPILFLWDHHLIQRDTPILIGEKVYQRPYFQYYLQHTSLGELNWVVQKKNQWIKVKEVKKAFVSMEVFKSTYGMIPLTKNPHRRVFLNRKNFFQRNIKNIGNLIEILKQHNFESFYAEDLSYEEQVKLFSQVKYFVGIHGAGLTNLLHSQISSLRVLEIFSESLIHASFYRFLKILKVDYYDAIVGTPFDINWNFTVDEVEFKKAIIALLEEKV